MAQTGVAAFTITVAILEAAPVDTAAEEATQAIIKEEVTIGVAAAVVLEVVTTQVIIMGTAMVEAGTTVIMAIVAEDEEVAGATRKRQEVATSFFDAKK